MRAFLAIELGEQARRAAERATGALRQSVRERAVRWARPENYHVTLFFLGEIDPGSVAELAREVGRRVRDVAPFEVHFAGLEAFPSARRPRVIAARLEPEAPLSALAARVAEGCEAAGFPSEARRFRAHLTLGRLRDRAHPDLTAVELEAASLLVSEVVLFESALHPDGAVHTPRERLPLTGPVSKTQTPTGELHAEEHPLH